MLHLVAVIRKLRVITVCLVFEVMKKSTLDVSSGQIAFSQTFSLPSMLIYYAIYKPALYSPTGSVSCVRIYNIVTNITARCL